ncbi:hypothetical protein EV121DRAFT_297546 [Schizophyllum commune]
MECNVAVTRACSPGALSLKLTNGPYRSLASRSSIAFLFPYALHSTALAFNIVQAPIHPTLRHPYALHSAGFSFRQLSSSFATSLDLRGSFNLPHPSKLRASSTSMTSSSTFAFTIDFRLHYQPTHSQSTYAFCIRPPLFATDFRLSPPTSAPRSRPTGYAKHSRLRPSTAFDRPAQDHVLIAASSASKVEFSSASKVESSSASKKSSSASKDLRGKHNARRFLGSFLLEDNDHRIVRGKYKRREGKVTQVYRKKWVINRLLASITAARFHHSPLAIITAALSSHLSAARLLPSSTTRPKSLVKPESSREAMYRRPPSEVMGL